MQTEEGLDLSAAAAPCVFEPHINARTKKVKWLVRVEAIHTNDGWYTIGQITQTWKAGPYVATFNGQTQYNADQLRLIADQLEAANAAEEI